MNGLKKLKSKKADEVVIFIGLIQWREKERKLVAARSKRVALRILNKAPYADVRSKGIEKWKAYHSNKFDEDEEYSLVYQDGQEAIFLPGTKECFTAKRYKGEIGKDYKRITLYLCSNYDLQKNEEDEFLEPAEKKSKSQVKQDEIIARELQSEFNNVMIPLISHTRTKMRQLLQRTRY